jgi:hypothetical protein
MFGLGSREAVVAALAGDPTGFGAPAPEEVLLEAFAAVGLPGESDPAGGVVVRLPREPQEAGAAGVRLDALATAHGWTRDGDDVTGAAAAVFHRATP